MLEEALKSLIASGPLAIILGYGLSVVWADLRETRKALAEAKDKGAADVAAAEKRSDEALEKLRIECTAERNALQAKLDAQGKELVSTVKELTGALKDSHGG